MRILYVTIRAMVLAFGLLYLTSCCKSDLHGDYLLDTLARKYVLDTSVKSFDMVDSRGFRESFTGSGSYSFYEGGNIDRCGVQFRMQMFSAEYISSVNRYYFGYTVWAGTGQDEAPRLWIHWNNDLFLDYDLQTKSVLNEDGQVRVKMLDTLSVQGQRYTDVLEVDFFSQGWILYIAPPDGLIKIVRPDGIYSERVLR